MKSLFLILFPALVFGTQVISEQSHVSCEEFSLKRELKVYKDPSLFLPNLSQLYTNPKLGWEELLKESPLLTTVKGSFHMMRLGPVREFSNFGGIERLYELSDPSFRPRLKEGKNHEWKVKKPLMIPIKVCGMNDAYSDSLGFVLQSDLAQAQIAEDSENAAMPPSTVGNPIPKLKKQE